jgi:hypothetical protein
MVKEACLFVLPTLWLEFKPPNVNIKNFEKSQVSLGQIHLSPAEPGLEKQVILLLTEFFCLSPLKKISKLINLPSAKSS